jgi:hypothetical protein
MTDRKSINSHNDDEQISNTDLSNLENQRNNYLNPLPTVQSPRSVSEHSKDSINEHEPNETTSLLEGAREPPARYSYIHSSREDDDAFRLLPIIYFCLTM